MAGSNAIDLDTPHSLTSEQIRHFRERGYVKLKNVLSPATIEHYGEAITAEVKRLNKMHKPMSERTTYQRAFLQVMNIWRQSDTVRAFSFSQKLARLAPERFINSHAAHALTKRLLVNHARTARAELEPGGGSVFAVCGMFLLQTFN